MQPLALVFTMTVEGQGGFAYIQLNATHSGLCLCWHPPQGSFCGSLLLHSCCEYPRVPAAVLAACFVKCKKSVAQVVGVTGGQLERILKLNKLHCLILRACNSNIVGHCCCLKA